MFFILTMYAAVALAQWGNSATESLWVNTADEYYYSFDVQQAHNGNTWFYMDYAPDAHCVQLYDSTGVALLGDKWMLVSNYPDRITGYVIGVPTQPTKYRKPAKCCGVRMVFRLMEAMVLISMPVWVLRS